MAITAKFTADFTSFQQAISKAQVSLNLWEASIKKTELAMKTLGDSFSGRKSIQEAQMVATAVDKIGGASRLTATEQQRVNAVVTEAIAKYRALGQEAPRHLTDLAEATRRLEPPLTMAQKATGLLSSAFGQFTAANLVAGAITTVTGKVGEFVAQGQKLPALQTSFDRLAKGIGQNSDDMLQNMQRASRGLVSDFDLIQSANKAMLLGLPVTAESMGELTQAATVLGRAMGQDAAKSVDDLITALGRSSPMILDNLGITVKVGEANEAYAQKLGKTAESLSEAEKKTAFFEAAMEKARAKTKELGDQSLTLSEMVGRAWVAIGNIVSRSAATMNVGIGSVLSSMKNFALFMKESAKFGISQAILMAATREQAKALEASGQVTEKGARTWRAYALELERATATMPKLTAEELRNYQAAVKIHTTTEELTREFGLSAIQQQILNDRLQQTTKSTKDLAKEGQALLDSYRKNNQLRFESGILLQKEVNDLTKSVTAKRSLMVITDQIVGMERTWRESLAFTGRELDLNKRKMELTARFMATDWRQEQERNHGLLEKAAIALERQRRAFGVFIGGALDFARALPGSLRTAVTAVGELVGSFDSLRKATQQLKADANRTWGEMAANVLSWAGLVTSYVQTVARFLERDTLTAASRHAFEQAHGGLANLRAEAVLAGISIDNMLETRSASEFQRAVEKIEDAIQRQKDLMDRYGLTWRDMGQAIRQSQIANISRQLVDDFRQLSARGADALGAMSGSFNQLIIDAVKTGTKIPKALEPMIQSLIRSKKISEQAARALLGIADDGVPSLEDIRAAAERYGLTLDQLGPKVQQLRITELANQLVKDFQIFTAAGVDSNVMLDAMKAKAIELVKTALAMGLVLPESMRPFLQRLVDAGLLTDQFGNKLENLDQINFAEDLTSKIDDLIEALMKLVDAFTGVGDAAETAGRKMREGMSIPTGTAIPRPLTQLASGGIVTRPTLAMIGEKGPEAIIPLSGTNTEPMVINITTTLDGREIAHNQVRYFPDVARLYVGNAA